MDDRVHASLTWLAGQSRQSPARGDRAGTGADRACLDSAHLTSGVDAHLGRHVFVPKEAADVDLQVRIESDSQTDFRVRVDLVGKKGLIGTRVLEKKAENCAQFRSKLVLVVAMLLDIERADIEEPSGHGAAGAASTPESTEPRPRGSPRPIAAPEPRAERNRDVHTLAGLLGGVSFGVVPSPAFFISAVGIFGSDQFLAARAALDVSPYAPTKVAEGQVMFRAVGLGVGVAPRIVTPFDAVTLRGWASGKVTAVYASGSAFDVNPSDTQTFAAFELGGRGEVSLGATLLGCVEIGATVPLAHPTFSYVRADQTRVQVHQVAPVALNIGLGVVW
jgi:hypothetical protein